MMISEEVVERIDRFKLERLRDMCVKGMGLELTRFGDVVLTGMKLCELKDIGDLLCNLEALRFAVEEETGILF